jgi:methyl-accepting chemotaxis protein
MAQVRQDVILTFDADTGQVDKSVDILSAKLDRLTSAIEDMTDEFIDAGQAAKRAAEATDDIGEAAEDSGKALKEAGEKGATGFTRLKDALAATGLFALATP